MSEGTGIKFQFRYIVDLGHNQIAEIFINQLSDPYVEASKFCARLGLTSALITILGDALARQIETEKQQICKQNHRSRKESKPGQILKQKTQPTQPRTLATEQRQEGCCSREGLVEICHQQMNSDKRNPSQKDNFFDSLYRRHKEQQTKKQLVRKRSFEAIPFRPKINTISGIIVATKRRLSTAQSKPSSVEENRHGRCSGSIESGRKKEERRDEWVGKDGIYARGQEFRARSSERRQKIKRQLENKLMEDCTFKPKITSRWR